MIEQILNSEGSQIVSQIQSNIQAGDKNASGSTSRSLKSEVTKKGNNTTLLIDAVRHFTVLEKGRKPGKMPRIGKIEQWIKDRGLPYSAWGVAKNIAKKGTKLFQEGGRKDIYSNVITDERIVSIIDLIADESVLDAANTLVKKKV